MQYLRVKNWDEFQHYKDRSPPWIKLHRDLLRDYNFTRLQDASKLHLMLIWLLASQMDNKIPADADFIRNQLNVKGDVDFKPLIEQGFLIDDSNTLAGRKQLAIVETETETETELPKGSSSRKVGKRLPDNWLVSEDLLKSIMEKEGFTDEQVVNEEYSFRNYWFAESGAKARKRDWDRAFRTWCGQPYCASRKGLSGTVRSGGGSQGAVQLAEAGADAARRRKAVGKDASDLSS